jgi:hypothetical protein
MRSSTGSPAAATPSPAALHADPDDDEARAVYADAPIERGDLIASVDGTAAVQARCSTERDRV